LEKPVPPEVPAPPVAQVITIDDFVKVELRAATVLEAEKVPKADKLLRLVVDLGEPQPRQILAGIAQHYSPEEVVGRKIIIVANLAPRKLRGLESNGMLLAASVGEDGKPVLATFAEEVPNGTRLK
jgi:methionyl-tRNA synthetase